MDQYGNCPHLKITREMLANLHLLLLHHQEELFGKFCMILCRQVVQTFVHWQADMPVVILVVIRIGCSLMTSSAGLGMPTSWFSKKSGQFSISFSHCHSLDTTRACKPNRNKHSDSDSDTHTHTLKVYSVSKLPR